MWAYGGHAARNEPAGGNFNSVILLCGRSCLGPFVRLGSPLKKRPVVFSGCSKEHTTILAIEA
jgi:hypothetical protein